VSLSGKTVLEVGCGDGGCAVEIVRAGAEVTAVDIEERLVGIARELNQREGVEMSVHTGNVMDPACAGLERGPFDLILLRDVVEHLEDLPKALRILTEHLAPGGQMLMVFPPYYSPFGAHQQILPRRKLGPIPYNKLPFIQLLPDAMFLRLVAGDTAHHREVARLRGIRLTLKRFVDQTARCGLRISHKKLYLLRPTFKLRYGLPVVGASLLGEVPLLRELLITGAYYLLERQVDQSTTR